MPFQSPANAYTLPRGQVQELTAQLLQARPSRSDSNFICYELDSASHYTPIGQFVEARVFEAAFGNTPEDMQREYGPYEEASRFFVTIDRKNQSPVGVTRAIEGTPAALKTFHDLPRWLPNIDMELVYRLHDIRPDTALWDVGTLAVLPEYRDGSGKGSAASIQLFRALYISALRHSITGMVSIIDKKAHKKLTQFLGVPFTPLGNTEPFSYLGSESSRAVYGYVNGFYDKMTAPPKTPLAKLRRHLASTAHRKLTTDELDHTIELL